MYFRTIIPAVMGSLLVAIHANDARACGGCFHPPTPPTQSGTVVTDHRMIFTISPQATTLYDEIKYAGSPADFAWVLPIHGQVTVGLSSDAVFSALEQATQTSIVSPSLPPCPVSNCPCGFGSFADASAADAASFGGSVTIITQQTIGPYDTVQLKSTDPNALNSWLTANGYDISTNVRPVIAAYVAEGFDFLALKLAPGQGVQAMRPVRVTTPGAGLSLPLRMVAAGTGAIVGITLWVIADGSYEPQNFQFFTISSSELTWDWSINRSNYTTLQVQKEGALGNAAWQIESSLSVSPYAIDNAVLQAPNDYMPLPISDGGASSTTVDGGQAQAADLSVLFPEGTVPMRITRMRSDLAHAALANDLVLQAASDQTVISNVYQVTKSVNAPTCPMPPPCNCGPGGSGGDGGAGRSSGSSSSGGSRGAGGSGLFGGSGGAGNSGSPDGSSNTGNVGSDGGPTANGLSPGGGCAASTSEPGNGALEFIAAGFAGMAVLRARRRRR
jgi:MYXO-CTERM domain-containing protein